MIDKFHLKLNFFFICTKKLISLSLSHSLSPPHTLSLSPSLPSYSFLSYLSPPSSDTLLPLFLLSLSFLALSLSCTRVTEKNFLPLFRHLQRNLFLISLECTSEKVFHCHICHLPSSPSRHSPSSYPVWATRNFLHTRKPPRHSFLSLAPR